MKPNAASAKGRLAKLRRDFHRRVCSDVLRLGANGAPNNADSASASSVALAQGIVEGIGLAIPSGRVSGQTAGRQFEAATKDFLRRSFELLGGIRPGDWTFALGGKIDSFHQYRHLDELQVALESNKKLRTAFADYIIKPDIVVSRSPVADEEVNRRGTVVQGDEASNLTPLRQANSSTQLLHASISCKWTIRSDRSQNARTEGLNLVRNRKGRTPHIAVVVGEPLPGRIASLALGTGDIDCVYHFALPELEEAAADRDSDLDLLRMMIEGDRLRDISDLPFDLAI